MTTLIRHGWFDEFDLLFKNFFETESRFNTIVERKIPYPVDISETEDAINIDIAAIGLNEDDILIDVEDDILRVSYKKPSETDDSKYVQKSISRKSFDLGWKVSNKYDLEKITAKLDKGLLGIKIPIKPEEKPKKFEIKINK